MNYGKTIRIYLPDGSVSGIRMGEMANWTGQAIACPRNRIGDLKDWQETIRPGVYFLFGQDQETGANLAYVGEAEVVQSRLSEHLKGKDFWSEAIVFTSKDEHVNKAHVKYLEARMADLAIKAGRYTVVNGNTPPMPALSRSDRDAMEEFIYHARTVLGALGHRLLEPLVPVQRAAPVVAKVEVAPSPSLEMATSNDVLSFQTKRLQAQGMQTDDGFVVLKGSQATLKEFSSITPGLKKLRDRLLADGSLIQDGDRLVFAKPVLFSSPSAASSLITAQSRNGLEDWRNPAGKSLKELERLSVEPG